jgi:hypothetical protein
MDVFAALQLVLTAERRRRGDMAFGGENERLVEGVPAQSARRLFFETS